MKVRFEVAVKITTQIYELQDLQEAKAMIELGVNRIGSVLLSQRDWKDDNIKHISDYVNNVKIKHSIIPLFSEPDTVYCVIDYYEPDVIHFCESLVSSSGKKVSLDLFTALQRGVKKRFPQVEIMRSIPVAISGGKKLPTLEIAHTLEETTDCFLTDTWIGKEPVDGFIGITGKTCDWDTARALVDSSEIPVILAGGLAPENVYDGIMRVRPVGVDSCTQTNMVDNTGAPIRFKKDVHRVMRFLEETHRAEADLDPQRSNWKKHSRS